MFLFFVRHGMPDYENDTLTDYGKQEAQALSKRFALIGLDKIYSSTMGRAMMTSTVTVYRIRDDGEEHIPQICLYGNDSHLYKEELLENFDGRTF